MLKRMDLSLDFGFVDSAPLKFCLVCVFLAR